MKGPTPPEKLPSEVEEDVLCRVSPLSLIRFKTVCKRWKSLFSDEFFIKNHLAHPRPQFLLRTSFEIYSVQIIDLDNPSIEVHSLYSDTPSGTGITMRRHIFSSDGLFLCATLKNVLVFWNPWLRQTTWIIPLINTQKYFGFGYDRSKPENGYKILTFNYFYSLVNFGNVDRTVLLRATIYEFASSAWRHLAVGSLNWSLKYVVTFVSLNGSLYWIAVKHSTDKLFIQSFDFSKEEFKPLCLLPCMDALGDIHVLALMSLMTVSIPNFPKLQHNKDSIYFLEDKTLVIFTFDEDGEACVFFVKGG